MLTYTEEFLLPNLMGPNCIKIAAELARHVQVLAGWRVMDLGCGTGLTSMFFADHYKAQVFATDLWITPTDNYKRFKEFGMERQVIPIHADATALPYADGYFDAVLSVDSYHYFGSNPHYLQKLAPLVKKRGFIAVVMPGLLKEFPGEVFPAELQPFWQGDMNFHSAEWWKELWEASGLVEIIEAFDLSCHAEAWADWLKCDNPYAKHDIDMMEAEAGKYFNTVGLVARVR